MDRCGPGTEREREEEEEWLEGEGTAVPGRAVRWYPRGSSAAGVKIRERVEEVGLCRSSEFLAPGRLENIGTGNIRGISSSFLLSLSLVVQGNTADAWKQ